MKFYKYINDIPEKPIVGGEETEFNPGDTIMVRKGTQANYYWEQYKVAADGLIHFVRGITDDQWGRMERLSYEQISKVELISTEDIDKLKEDYSRQEIDDQIDQVKNLANSSRINIGASRILPVPPERPDGTEITDAWTELIPGAVYTQSGGDDIQGLDGNRSIAEWDGTSWYLVDMGELPQVDTSGLVAKSDIKNNSLIRSDSEYIEINTAIYSDGSAVTDPSILLGAVSIVDFPLQSDKTYTIGGFRENNSAFICLANSEGSVKTESISTLATLPKTFSVTDDGYRFLRCSLKGRDAVEPDDNWSDTLMLNEGDILLPKIIGSIEGASLEAKSLSIGNTVPNPETDNNAVNKKYFDNNAIKNSDLDVSYSANIANPDDIITGRYVTNNGSLASGAGWKMIAIDVSNIPDDTPITFGRFSIQTAGYSAFYTELEGDLVQYNGHTGPNPVLRTYIKPAGATVLYIDISRPTGVNEYSQITANVGTELIDYVPYATLSAIKGITLGGGTSNVTKFSELTDAPSYSGNAGKGLKINDEANGLDVYDPVEHNSDVIFNTVTATAITINDMPVWDETGMPPIEIGDDYNFPDGNGNYFRKTRGV